MYEKHGKYFADWTTPDGKRHRKSFSTAIGAKRHQTKQKAVNNAGKRLLTPQWPHGWTRDTGVLPVGVDDNIEGKDTLGRPLDDVMGAL